MILQETVPNCYGLGNHDKHIQQESDKRRKKANGI